MNYSRLNNISNLLFGFILAVGVMYSLLLFWIFVKTAPGMIMFLVYLLDSRSHGYELSGLGAYHELLTSTSLSLLSIALLTKMIMSALKTRKIILKTRSFISNLNIVSRKGIKYVFSSNTGDVFTAGFFNPKIYIASGLSELHEEKEIRAMIAHERRHVEAKDPLRSTLVSMISGGMPRFPYKEKVARTFYTLMEICADRMAEEKLADKTPVVMALYKRLGMTNKGMLLGINFFNTQSDRIQILVGKKRLQNRQVMSAVSFALIVLTVGTYTIIEASFYNCPHLRLCLSSLTSVLNLH